MTKNTKLILFLVLGLGIVALIGYGLFSSKKIEAHQEKSVDSNIDGYIYDESKDTLPEEKEEDDLDGDEAIIEDDDFEVYEEEGGWDSETSEPTTASSTRDDNELEELYDNKPTPPAKKEPTIEKIKPTEASVPSAISNEGDYLVIAGSFKSKRNARKKIKALEKKGFTGSILQLKNSDLQTVIAGRFATEDEAETLAKEIKSKDLKAIVKLEE